MKYFSNLVLILVLALAIFQQVQLLKLKESIHVVYNRQSLREQKYKLQETDFVRTAKNSVVILRCSDKTIPVKSWVATATKVHPSHIVSVFHSISPLSNNETRTYPVNCTLTQEGAKIGEIRINSEKEARKTQVGSRDIALIPVAFNDRGREIPLLSPIELPRIAVGDVIALISSPAKFHLDAVVSFGVILAKKVKNSLRTEYQTLWEDAVSSDVIAFGGSSGGALIHFDPSPNFVGIHVGTNGANGLYLAYYQLLFDETFFNKFNALP